ncbi:hypothetical protein VQ7734_02273 [Vibrio quintilis]|uniref:Uncharacterized protein n=2 Tax=Vibrio quintilis TaxID=1117707 RepID=A0A1M7YV45_9VIBR|nr:hypothetical protein VQ7734_02273 [Vibrio quintilis]
MKIEQYQVQHFAGGTGYFLKAMIWLYDEDHATFANVRFYKDPDDVPAQDTKASSGFIACHYPPEDYADVIDLLRNEKPLYLHYSDTSQMGYFSTAPEPVGEGEI